MPVSVVDVVGAMKEVVRDKLQPIYESTDEIAGMFKKASGDRIQISRYLYRVPLQLFRGGNFHKYSTDGGTFGIGTGMLISSLQAGYITALRSYRVTDEEADTTSTDVQAAVNVFNKTLADAMLEAQIDDDIALHTDGTGILTNASSATNGTTTLTFAAATDTLGVNRLREGITVDVWDATGVTLRVPSSGTQPTVINSIDYSNKIVTLNQSIASLTSTDILSFPGLTAYGPAALTSFSSTWPGSGLTNGPGLTGDSFRHGIYYSNDATTSNYYLTKLKSTIPQLLATQVNASSSAFTFAMVLQGMDQVIQRRDKDATKGLRGICHMKQRQAIFQIQVNVSNKIFGWGGDKMNDFMPTGTGYTDEFDLCGIPTRISKRQYNDRIDFVNPLLWGRAQTRDIHFVEKGGRQQFEVRNADGTMAASTEFHISTNFDFVNYDPGIGLYISSLNVPT